MSDADATNPGLLERDLLLAALDHPAEERERYLEEACQGRESLRDRVRQLLRNAEQDDSFMASPAIDLGETTTLESFEVGRRVGRYRLMEQIGEGGMGVVFVAEQTEPISRKVALKVIKPGMDSKTIIARFEAERQALAMMDHPNIARVLDAGTTSERLPYFVMELVRGVPITEYCDQAKASIEERLRLFQDVCAAVQHAHQKGIIHRDLKPSNILVTLHDGKPVVKVIDFGVAKALHQLLTDHTVYTAFNQVLGTPLYMSPEQLEMSGLDIDTRTDVYSLGVLLYELVTGTTPFDRERLLKSGFDEMRRIIREEEPPLPSQRVTALAIADQSTIAENRKIDNRELKRCFRHEIDWIVIKTLEKDRQRRYAAAKDISDDIHRFLNDEPVEAGPPSFIYRTSKFIKRYRIALTTLSLISIAILGGAAASAWYGIEALRAKDRAITSDNAARKAVDDMYTQFAERWLAEQGNATAVQKEFLEKALRFYQLEADRDNENTSLADQLQAQLRVAGINKKLGNFEESKKHFLGVLQTIDSLDESSSQNFFALKLDTILQFGEYYRLLSLKDEATRLTIRASELIDLIPKPESLALDEQARIANLLSQVAVRFEQEKLRTDAERAMQMSHQIWDGLLQQQPNNWSYRLERAKAYKREGVLTMWWGNRNEEAKKSFELSLSHFTDLLDLNPADRDCRHGLASVHQSLGVLATWRKDDASSDVHYRTGGGIANELVRDFPTDQEYLTTQINILSNHLGVLLRLGRQSEADELALAHLRATKRRAEHFSSVPTYLENYRNAVHYALSVFKRKGKLSEAQRETEYALKLINQAVHSGSAGDNAYIARISSWAKLDHAFILMVLGHHAESIETIDEYDFSLHAISPNEIEASILSDKQRDLKYLKICSDLVYSQQIPATLAYIALHEARAKSKSTEEDLLVLSEKVERINRAVKREVDSLHNYWLERITKIKPNNSLLLDFHRRYLRVYEDQWLNFTDKIASDSYGRLSREIFSMVERRVDEGHHEELSFAINELANGHSYARNPQLALKFAKIRSEANPNSVMAKQDLAFAQFRNGNVQECLKLLGDQVRIGDATVSGIYAMALWQSGQKAKARRYLGNEYRAALDTYCQNCLEAEKQGRTALPTADQLRNVDREATEMCFSESDDSLPEQHAIPLPADSSVQRGTEAFLDTNVFAWITNERKRMKDRATKLFNEQRDRPAIRAYSELMETYPDEGCLVLNHKNRGIAYSRLRDFDHALSDLNTASELAPNDWEVVAARAKVFSSLRRFDEALMEIDQLIRANYQVKKTHFERAYILAQLRRYEEAIESIQNCLNVEDADFDPTIPKCDLHAFQGAIYLRGLRDASRAVAELTSALESDPWLSYRYDEPFLFRLRAEAHRSLGAQEKAEADEESAEEIELGSKAHTNQPQ